MVSGLQQFRFSRKYHGSTGQRLSIGSRPRGCALSITFRTNYAVHIKSKKHHGEVCPDIDQTLTLPE